MYIHRPQDFQSNTQTCYRDFQERRYLGRAAFSPDSLAPLYQPLETPLQPDVWCPLCKAFLEGRGKKVPDPVSPLAHMYVGSVETVTYTVRMKLPLGIQPFPTGAKMGTVVPTENRHATVQKWTVQECHKVEPVRDPDEEEEEVAAPETNIWEVTLVPDSPKHQFELGMHFERIWTTNESTPRISTLQKMLTEHNIYAHVFANQQHLIVRSFRPIEPFITDVDGMPVVFEVD